MAGRPKPFSVDNPYRDKRPITDKIIFIVCEGQVTEIEYFNLVMTFFDNIKSRIQIIPILENELYTAKHIRTNEQNEILSKSKPDQLLKKMNDFKENEDSKYEFSKHPDDEFWLIMDVDDHTAEYYKEKWNEVLSECDYRNYKCAISNPFFELWLLLHHCNVNDEDYSYAVTTTNSYKKTNHFRERLREINAPLKDNKHICGEHYEKSKINNAIARAKELDSKCEKWPTNLGSTMYKLMEILFILDVEAS